jgi:hypothetical protein
MRGPDDAERALIPMVSLEASVYFLPVTVCFKIFDLST